MARKVKLKISTRLLRKKTRRGSFSGAKHCRFCANDEAAALSIIRMLGCSEALLQSGARFCLLVFPAPVLASAKLTAQIKNARVMALLPYTAAIYSSGSKLATNLFIS